jgi:hypothetical protein
MPPPFPGMKHARSETLDTIGKKLDLSKDPVFSGEQNCIINGQKAT